MSFASRIITWQKQHGRHHLPWQCPGDLYRIWVSEIMLQQTQVATAIPYFRRFLRSFPNTKRLAEAPLDAVLAHWSGLGYYARARNLHRAARQVRDEGGRLPRTTEQWMRLPGVGRSTAGAIVSLGLDQPAVMLDGNARRVFTRHQGLPPRTDQVLWERAEELLPKEDAATYTQGLMDLGANICTTREPACVRCPLRRDCCHHQNPQVATERPTPIRMREHTMWLAVLHSCDGQILLRPRDRDGLWGGLWGFPEFTSDAQIRHWAHKRTQPLRWRKKPALVHRLSHLKLTLHALHAEVPQDTKACFKHDGRWFDPAQREVGVAAIVPKLLRQS